MRIPTPLPACLRRIAAPGMAVLTDAELVGRFAEQRDAAAFEVLVWRHGPMVWATCRRVLRHQQDAEDAFQAAFVALAGNARSISDKQVLGGWLHRVAVNAALKLKSARRPSALPAEVPARPTGAPDGGAFAGAVDEELNRLPDRMRAAFVLCCLEGLTAAEAARELGCPVGTVDSRLHAARVRLRGRLTRRGFGPGALAGLVVIASPPRSVLAAAVGISDGIRPDPAVHALAAHVSRTMNRGVLTMKTGICAMLVASLTGTVWALGATSKDPAPTPEVRFPPAALPAPAAPPVTAWGKPVMGLQAGLRCPKQSLDAGASAEVEVVVRNVGKEPVAFEYLAWENQSGGSVFLSGVPEQDELRLGWVSYINGNPQIKSARLGPNEEMVRGRVTLTHGRAKPVAPGARPPIELPPGKYRLSLDPVGEPTLDRLGGAAFPRLGTGVLELDLPRALVRVAGDAPAPLAVPKPPEAALKPDPKAGPVGDELKGIWTGKVASPDGNNVRGMVLRFVDGKHLVWTTTQATPGVRSTFTTRFEYKVKDGELVLRALEKYYGEEKVLPGPDDKAPQPYSFAWTGDKKDGFRIRNKAARESPWATVTLKRVEERTDQSDPLVLPALWKLARAIKKEPAYTGAPLYLLLAIGPDAGSRVWVILDGTTLYVDRNGNGDLTEAGEKVAARAAPGTKPDPRSPEFLVGELPGPAGVKHTGVLVSVVRTPAVGVTARVMVRVGGKVPQVTVLPLAGSPTDARVVHFGGRVVTARPSVSMPDAPDANGPTDFRVQVGTPGVGAGSFAAYGNADLPDGVGPVAEFVFTPTAPQGAPKRVTVRLTSRCCGDQFYGELTVPPGAKAGLGAARVTLSFPDCPWGKVKPATYPVDVIPKRR